MSEPAATDTPTLFDVKEMELNFGPQHPSTHGVLRLKLKVDGERIRECYPIIGYLHRGTEKLFELHPFFQNVPHTDRMDYIAAATSNLAYCGAVEKLLGFSTPPRAQYIRVMLCELQRISSHLLWLATHAIDIGAMTPFFYCFREREQILDLFEEYCGARLTLNCMRPGGQPYDLPIGWLDQCAEFAAKFDACVDEYEGLLTNNRIWKQRTVGIGVLPPEVAIDYGISGPMLRGSGVNWDLRKNRPYECYHELEFDVPLGTNCDTYDRYLVRVEEMRQSARILTQCVEKIPDGAIMCKKPRVIKSAKETEVYSSIEGPKGEIGFYIVGDGTAIPWRCHVRAPSFITLQALPELVKDTLLADLVAIIGTTDIVLGEVDR
ncbi:MAG: NADH-quinone oxidoreductase subunit D [Acidobacteriota bacterium]|nr:NADH-quinone oxidoreductase subunit D [Acidobacteriota bacterium]